MRVYKSQMTFTLSPEVISFIDMMKKGDRSRWVDDCLKQHIGELLEVNLDMWEALIDELDELNRVIEWQTRARPVSEIWDDKLGEMVPGEPLPPPDFGPGDGEPELERDETVYLLYKRQFAKRQFVNEDEIEAQNEPDSDGRSWLDPGYEHAYYRWRNY